MNKTPALYEPAIRCVKVRVPGLRRILENPAIPLKKTVFFHLIDPNDEELEGSCDGYSQFMVDLPFRHKESFYYVASNDPYPKELWWIEPNPNGAKAFAGTLHLDNEKNTEYLLTTEGKKIYPQPKPHLELVKP